VIRPHERRLLIAPIVGVVAALALAGFALVTHPSPNHFSFVVEPAGTSWWLTPRSTWCNVTSVPGGGYEYACSMSGAASFLLNVTVPSRILGTLQVDGAYSVWIFPTVWGCEIEAQLTGFPLPCPVPYDPPPWSTWNSSILLHGTLDLSALQFNVNYTTGILPPTSWTLLVVDCQSSGESARVLSPVLLANY
jgi:hypothetical protein